MKTITRPAGIALPTLFAGAALAKESPTSVPGATTVDTAAGNPVE
jgi:hypothetical protein